MYHEPTLLGLSFCGKIEGCSSVEASSVSIIVSGFLELAALAIEKIQKGGTRDYD
jgi:hypothetical protein